MSGIQQKRAMSTSDELLILFFHTTLSFSSPEIFSNIFLKALLPRHSITYQVMAKCPLGEQNNIMLSGLLDLW